MQGILKFSWILQWLLYFVYIFVLYFSACKSLLRSTIGKQAKYSHLSWPFKWISFTRILAEISSNVKLRVESSLILKMGELLDVLFKNRLNLQVNWFLLSHQKLRCKKWTRKRIDTIKCNILCSLFIFWMSSEPSGCFLIRIRVMDPEFLAKRGIMMSNTGVSGSYSTGASSYMSIFLKSNAEVFLHGGLFAEKIWT